MKMLKKNNNYYSFESISESFFVNKLPFLLWITGVYIAAIVYQNAQSPQKIISVIVGGFITVHILLYWFSDRLIAKRRWIYLMLQTAVVFAAAFIMQEGSIALLVGLLPLLIAQSIIILKKTIQVILIFAFLYSQYCVAIVIKYGTRELFHFILIFLCILIIVIFYCIVYNGQVNARIRTQYYLTELETAHKKLEELTLANERQRMARDLHDTLAQGLAGLIMQLEAVDSHLHNGNTIRSQEIIYKSMEQARRTLRDARTAIDNLRENSISKIDFQDAVMEEIKRFTEATSIEIESDIKNIFRLNNFIREHSLYIISEGLTNIAKHSQATKATIVVGEENNHLHIEIKDNGIGFSNQSQAQYGKYGLLGLKERVRLIGGNINIESRPKEGTKILVTTPFKERK
ncbi:sensor histidine kinase [Niallia nealsonii]|nr:sensor histidine kinase [Niallia nealsonii]